MIHRWHVDALLQADSAFLYIFTGSARVFGYTVYRGFLNQLYGKLQLKLRVFDISLSLNFRYKVYLGIILGIFGWILDILTNIFSGILVYHYPLADPVFSWTKKCKERKLHEQGVPCKVPRWVKFHLHSLPWDFLTTFSSQAEVPRYCFGRHVELVVDHRHPRRSHYDDICRYISSIYVWDPKFSERKNSKFKKCFAG